jgi:hypothetical protein
MDRGLQLSKGTVVVSKRLVTPKPEKWLPVLTDCNGEHEEQNQEESSPNGDLHLTPLGV